MGFSVCKTIFCLLVCTVSFCAGAITVDWSGASRGEIYLQGDKKFHGTFHLTLKPVIQVMDGLTVSARVSAVNWKKSDRFFEELRLPMSRPQPRPAIFILYDDTLSGTEERSYLQYGLSLSQFYITWRGEFTRLQIGRAPYRFGMGLTYSDEDSVFANWISRLTWLSLYLKYDRFYLQPALAVQGKDEVFPLLAGGAETEKWKAEGLYQYKDNHHFVEVFGRYEKDFWTAELSLSYGFSRENLALAFEWGADLWFALKPRVELKGGYSAKDFFFHPNYEAGLFLWNYGISEAGSAGVGGGKEAGCHPRRLWIEEGCINDAFYLNPRVVFSFPEGNFKAVPQFTVGRQLSDEQWIYELSLELEYNPEIFLSLRARGGIFYEREQPGFGILTQAAVDF